MGVVVISSPRLDHEFAAVNQITRIPALAQMNHRDSRSAPSHARNTPTSDPSSGEMHDPAVTGEGTESCRVPRAFSLVFGILKAFTFRWLRNTEYLTFSGTGIEIS